MQIENQFEIPVPAAAAWTILMNVSETAMCFPGAGMIESISDDQYQGRVTVKLGPLTLVFSGKLRIEDRNDTTYCATIKSNWTEARGRGNANIVTHIALLEQSGGTRVAMKSELQLAGQVAQYGRGVGMISEISAQLISIFADNLRVRIQAASGDGTTPSETRSAAEIAGLTLIAKALGNRLKR